MKERKMIRGFTLGVWAIVTAVFGGGEVAAETFVYDLKDGHIELEEDAAGRTLAVSFFGADGNLAAIPEGYAREVRTYDDAVGKETTEYYAADGGPATREGVHRFEAFRDKQNRLLSSACFSINGKPCTGYRGVHKWLWAYDDVKYVKTESTYGVDGQPFAVEGILKTVTEAPDWGVPTSKTLYGINDEPAADKYGVHRYEYVYADDLESCSVRCYDASGKLLPAEAVPDAAAESAIPY
jgi:hypothetical protein